MFLSAHSVYVNINVINYTLNFYTGRLQRVIAAENVQFAHVSFSNTLTFFENYLALLRKEFTFVWNLFYLKINIYTTKNRIIAFYSFQNFYFIPVIIFYNFIIETIILFKRAFILNAYISVYTFYIFSPLECSFLFKNNLLRATNLTAK